MLLIPMKDLTTLWKWLESSGVILGSLGMVDKCDQG